jgi:hypothetical protein
MHFRTFAIFRRLAVLATPSTRLMRTSLIDGDNSPTRDENLFPIVLSLRSKMTSFLSE